MFKTRVALLGVLALFIASGIAASTASAGQGPFWHVNGAKLGQGASKQVKFQAKYNETASLFRFSALGGAVVLELKCHNSYSEGGTIEGQGAFQGQDKARIVFEQCKTLFKAAEECKIVEPIRTNQLKSYLAYNNTKPENKQQKFVDVIEPSAAQAAGVFFVLHFEGKGCLFTEAKLEGSMAAEILPIEKESQELLFFFPGEPIGSVVHEQQERKIGLKFAEEPAVLSGAYGARLATNEPWGVFGT